MREQAVLAQIALAQLMAKKPWIVPISGTTEMAHIIQNIGASSVAFTPGEIKEAECLGIQYPDSRKTPAGRGSRILGYGRAPPKE